jgi:hypothetical protein
MIASIMLQKMVFSGKPILPLAGTAAYVAVNVLEINMSRCDVTVEIGFARESRCAACPIARYSFLMFSVSCDEVGPKAMK